MSAFLEKCANLEQDLVGLEKESQTTRAQLTELEERCTAYPGECLKMRLQLARCRLLVSALSQYGQHENKGDVYFLTSEAGWSVNWADDPRLADKEYFRQKGSILYSVEDITQMTDQLEEQIKTGDYSTVVSWLNQWES